MALIPLPSRPGPAPEVTGPRPHAQRSQNAPADLQEELARRALALPGVKQAASLVSVPGARAFVLDHRHAHGPRRAFQIGHEFAHLHPTADGSLHMTLPAAYAQAAFEKGWGVPHPLSGTPLIFGPRTREELEVVWQLLRASYDYASGNFADVPGVAPVATARR
jgi:phospholipase/carboxylesterase